MPGFAHQCTKQILLTLFPADRVKSIKNQAKMNVSPTDKLIKELLTEKQSLLDKLKEKTGQNLGYSEEGKVLWLLGIAWHGKNDHILLEKSNFDECITKKVLHVNIQWVRAMNSKVSGQCSRAMVNVPVQLP